MEMDIWSEMLFIAFGSQNRGRPYCIRRQMQM